MTDKSNYTRVED